MSLLLQIFKKETQRRVLSFYASSISACFTRIPCSINCLFAVAHAFLCILSFYSSVQPRHIVLFSINFSQHKPAVELGSNSSKMSMHISLTAPAARQQETIAAAGWLHSCLMISNGRGGRSSRADSRLRSANVPPSGSVAFTAACC